jgi:hypothetical protein
MIFRNPFKIYQHSLNFMTPTDIRLNIARAFISRVRTGFEDVFVDAYVFGSTSKRMAHESSDLDLFFIIHRPTEEERQKWNPPQEMKPGRNLILFKHQEEIYAIRNSFEEEYEIMISCYFSYDTQSYDFLKRLTGKTRMRWNELF